MQLHRVRIENFRSLREIEVEFGPSTVLVGENDAGVALVLDALARALGARANAGEFAFEPEDLAPADAGDKAELRIAIDLHPSRVGEWEEELHEPLRAELLGAAPREERLRFVLRVCASRKGSVITHWMLHSESGTSSDAPSLLVWLRTALPVFDFSRGLLDPATGSSPRQSAGPLRAAFAQWLAAQPSLDDASWEQIAPDIERLWDEIQRHMVPFRATSPWLASDFDFDLSRTAKGAPEPAFKSSPSARLGLILLAGALAHRSPGALHPQSSPLVVLAEPEAHLHPAARFALLGCLMHLRAQVIFSTHSSHVLVHLPLSALRRVVREPLRSRVFAVQPRVIPRDALRKIRYHLVTRHPEALLARAWLLVEGETEAWLLPELARAAGYYLPIEGVIVVEYAQCGLAPLLRLAASLHIEWHVLSDGDPAGATYAALARAHARGGSKSLRVSELPERDIETSFWRHGFSSVLKRLAGSPERRATESEPAFAHRTIRKALDRHSKPQVALKLIEALGSARAPRVPPPLARCLEATIELARSRPLLAGDRPAQRSRAKRSQAGDRNSD